MKHINQQHIFNLLQNSSKPTDERVNEILNKSLGLERLSLEETAILLQIEDSVQLQKLFHTAREVKERIYGKRIVLFAPLYLSNHCVNGCTYCAFRTGNRDLKRCSLDAEGVRRDVSTLLGEGHMRLLLVSGEAPPPGYELIEYYEEMIRAVYETEVGPYHIKRVNINCAPLSVDHFKRLKACGIGTYQIFQETYHDDTYRRVHPTGPKSDPDNRLDAVDRAFTAGIDDIGIGVLYGLYDYRYETLAMLSHVEYLEQKWNVGPHTISVPRIEPAAGSLLSRAVPSPVSDEDFMKLVAVLRLSVPYTGLILSTRETPEMRDKLVSLGISQISAGSNTEPGGYTENEDDLEQALESAQFQLNDHRTLDEMVGTLVEKGYIPSFCAACYRSHRTGEAFMGLAGHGEIRETCNMNALITLREYSEDFASPELKKSIEKLIEEETDVLPDGEKKIVNSCFKDIKDGKRDSYV
jgi:2-iminoacetate synthase